MKRLEFSEKKAFAIKFIEKIKEGYRLTGPNKAFDEAMKGIEPLPIQQASLYQFIRADEELSQAYFQARDSVRGRVMAGAKHKGVDQRVKLLELIIENIAQGMNIRGDVYRENAVVAACESLGLPVVHWATVHRWLRVEHKDLRDSFKNAMVAYREACAVKLKQATELYRQQSCGVDKNYKEAVAMARKLCNETILAAKGQREESIKNAKIKKQQQKRDLRAKYKAAIESRKNKLHDTATCGKIAIGQTNEN